MNQPPWNLFEVVGLEIEVMALDAGSFDPLPAVDRVLARQAKAELGVTDSEDGAIGWSNELVAHVAEFKNLIPVADLRGVAQDFHRSLLNFDSLLNDVGGVLVPGAMHPWMEPRRQTRFWPHAGGQVYAAYDRLFDCRRHGWANLQSTHLNLPFHGDEQFRRLHSAVRYLLPVLPALAAASPYREGAWSGAFDHRLQVYTLNAVRVPLMTGGVIPDVIGDEQEYRERILAPLQQAVSAIDDSGALRGEWLNSRGAIARFDRSAVEIRLLDAQENPQAEVALAALVTAAVRLLVEERFVPLKQLEAWPASRLRDLLDHASVVASRVHLPDDYLAAFGLRPHSGVRGRELWRHIARLAMPREQFEPFGGPLEAVFTHGTLAERQVSWAGLNPSRADLESLLIRMRASLLAGRVFVGR